jgi:hypothetical protein
LLRAAFTSRGDRWSGGNAGLSQERLVRCLRCQLCRLFVGRTLEMGREEESDRRRHDRAECDGEYDGNPVGVLDPSGKIFRIGWRRSIDDGRNPKTPVAAWARRSLAAIRGSRYDVLSTVRTCELEGHDAHETEHECCLPSALTATAIWAKSRFICFNQGEWTTFPISAYEYEAFHAFVNILAR